MVSKDGFGGNATSLERLGLKSCAPLMNQSVPSMDLDKLEAAAALISWWALHVSSAAAAASTLEWADHESEAASASSGCCWFQRAALEVALELGSISAAIEEAKKETGEQRLKKVVEG